MKILHEIEHFIDEFNTIHNEHFTIDTIRVEFSKEHKLKELQKLGKWQKVGKNSPLLPKLKQRLREEEITSAYRLGRENIYYYNTNQDRPKYRKAVMVIFGMKQYHKPPPPRALVENILQVLKGVNSIDVCIDLPYKPNIEAVGRYFTLTPYTTKEGAISNSTLYINDTGAVMLDKVIFYNKALKNGLKGILWRIEATIEIPNFKVLALPLYEFKQITDLARGSF